HTQPVRSLLAQIPSSFWSADAVTSPQPAEPHCLGGISAFPVCGPGTSNPGRARKPLGTRSAVTVLERGGASSPPERRSKKRRRSGGGARAPEGVRAPAAGQPRATKGAPPPPGTPPPSPMSSAIERKSLDPSE
ncbi:hypothetical protein Celaphus_00009301, partial [Cervus elaphus hippelaphus]